MDTRNDIFYDLTTLADEDIQALLRSPATCINLPKASPVFWRFFKNEKHKPKTVALRKVALDLLRQLLSHAALGEWEDAEKIWKLYPDLLICRGTIYHPNCIYQEGKTPTDIPIEMNPGRYKYVDRTAWQIAMMNEEYGEAKLMGKLMTKEEKQKQFAEIFPDRKIRKYDWDSEKAENLLQAVFNEVINDESIIEHDLSQMSEATQNALYALYAYMKPVPIHQSGLVFDANFYAKARQTYDDQFNQFKDWDQRSFWCIRVEEWLAGCLGTGYLRPHTQGISNDLKRTGCVLFSGSSYFAFRCKSGTGLFSNCYFVGRLGYAYVQSIFRHRPDDEPGDMAFSKLIPSKNKSRDKIYSAIFRSRKCQRI